MAEGESPVVLRLTDVRRAFAVPGALPWRRLPPVRALRGVSIIVRRGLTFGLVGESGCGKSTLARIMAGLDTADEGTVDPDPSRRRGAIQLVFQDPVGALNPRRTVGRSMEAPMRHLRRLPRRDRARGVEHWLEAVGLPADVRHRFPHELSGGQAQRVGIARALAASAELIVLDEPVSALDVSIQAQVLALLRDLQDRFSLTYLFISHDLAVVESVCDEVAVMYFGRIVEQAPAERLFAAPRHPYTRLLIDSVPVRGRATAAAAEGFPTASSAPTPTEVAGGCAFRARCPRSQDVCGFSDPELDAQGGPGAHRVACHFPL